MISNDTLNAIRRRLDPSDVEAAMVWRYLEGVCYVVETSNVPGDPYKTAFNEGRRSVFVDLAHIVTLPMTPGA